MMFRELSSNWGGVTYSKEPVHREDSWKQKTAYNIATHPQFGGVALKNARLNC